MRLHLRRYIRLLRIGLHLICVIPVGLLAAASRRPERWSQLWFGGLLNILNVQLRVHGSPGPACSLVAGNHVSWLDIAVLVTAKPVIFVSKAEVRGWPIIGWLARAGDTQFIERGAHGTQDLNDDLTRLLGQNRAVAIFPEGTTTRGPGVKRFQPRLFAGAINAQVPVQPFALRYRETSVAYVDDDTLGDNLWNLLAEPVIYAELHFGPPIPPGQHRKHLARRTQDWAEQALALPPTWPAPATTAPPERRLMGAKTPSRVTMRR